MFHRLHESPLFTDQAATYERLGMRAWREGIVPWRATSCPLLAEIEASLVEAFARDVAAPVTVIDVGAGTGRAGFHLAREFAARHLDVSLQLTDVAAGNVEALAAQPQLAALAEEGRVSFQVFDALAPPRLEGPTVLLAHYLFDTLPHRVFRRVGAQTFEGWVEIGDTLTWAFHPEAAPAGVLLPRDGTFLVPIGGMRALEAWRESCSGPLLVLAADKGVESWSAEQEPLLARHESTSAGVDFELLARAAVGFEHLAPAEPSPAFSLHAFVTQPGPELRAAWRTSGAGGEVLQVLEALKRPPETFDGLLEVIAHSRFDPDVVAQLTPKLLAVELTGSHAERLVQVVIASAQRHFHFTQQLDVPFNLAVLAHRVGALELAVALYLLSLRESGAHSSTLLNLARAQHGLHRTEAAVEALRVLLELEPTNDAASALLAEWS